MKPMPLFNATQRGTPLTNEQLADSLVRGDMLWVEFVDRENDASSYDGPVTVEIAPDNDWEYILRRVHATPNSEAGSSIFEWDHSMLIDVRDTYQDDPAEERTSLFNCKVFAAEIR